MTGGINNVASINNLRFFFFWPFKDFFLFSARKNFTLTPRLRSVDWEPISVPGIICDYELGYGPFLKGKETSRSYQYLFNQKLDIANWLRH